MQNNLTKQNIESILLVNPKHHASGTGAAITKRMKQSQPKPKNVQLQPQKQLRI